MPMIRMTTRSSIRVKPRSDSIRSRIFRSIWGLLVGLWSYGRRLVASRKSDHRYVRLVRQLPDRPIRVYRRCEAATLVSDDISPTFPGGQAKPCQLGPGRMALLDLVVDLEE